MAKEGKGVEVIDEEKKQQAETVVQELQEILKKQDDERLQPVTLWIDRINYERGVMYMGLSLGEGLGCSPFCGCAAKQIGDQFEPFLMERLPWLVRVVAEAEAPKEDGNPLLKFI
jgi:hypothetical protein